MDINNKSMVHLACRRGMYELDIIIMFFFKNEYDSLTDNEKYLFIRLLSFEDHDLLNWLINHERPNDDSLYHIIKIIRNKNKYRCSFKKK
ncbi:MAG: succinate dehydrogenase assembly factor 2 [Arsenophonus sp.]